MNRLFMTFMVLKVNGRQASRANLQNEHIYLFWSGAGQMEYRMPQYCQCAKVSGSIY